LGKPSPTYGVLICGRGGALLPQGNLEYFDLPDGWKLNP